MREIQVCIRLLALSSCFLRPSPPTRTSLARPARAPLSFHGPFPTLPPMHPLSHRSSSWHTGTVFPRLLSGSSHYLPRLGRTSTAHLLGANRLIATGPTTSPSVAARARGTAVQAAATACMVLTPHASVRSSNALQMQPSARLGAAEVSGLSSWRCVRGGRQMTLVQSTPR